MNKSRRPPSEPPRPLTPSEIDSLRQEMKDAEQKMRAAFKSRPLPVAKAQGDMRRYE